MNKFVRPNLIDDRVQHYRTLIKHARKIILTEVCYVHPKSEQREKANKIIQIIFLDWLSVRTKQLAASSYQSSTSLAMIQNWFDGAFHFRYVKKHLLTITLIYRGNLA